MVTPLINQSMLNLIQMAYLTRKSAPKGIYHNLEQIFQTINQHYFESSIEAEITWGRFGKLATRKRSIRLGSYCYRKKRIVIHPAMDQACVPRLCIERVIHHEMLHQKYPAFRHPSGRRSVHNSYFKQAEKLFKDAELADSWFKENLKKLLS